MTKKRSSEILADENRKFCREKVKFPQSLNFFSKIGGNLKQWGKMHHGLRGDGRPCIWRAVNFLLHRKSSSPLPSSIPSPSIADTVCSFLSDKISSFRFTLY